MESHSTSEVSLRHLPDLSESDTSFSFQIPHTVTSADLLTNTQLNLHDADDFFDGVHEDGNSITTPGTPKCLENADGPLTLSMLTPKPNPREREPAITLVQPSSPSRAHQNTRVTAADAERKSVFGNEVAKRRTAGVDAIENSPVSAKRFADLKAGVEFLLQDALEDDAGIFAPSKSQPFLDEHPVEAANPPAVSPRVNEAKRRKKPTVADGGITKKVPISVKPVSRSSAVTTKSGAAAASRLASAWLKPKPLPVAEDRIRPDGDEIGLDMPSKPPTAPATAAARLLQYGQSLIAQPQAANNGYEADEAIVTVTADEPSAPSEDASIGECSPRLNATVTLDAFAHPEPAAQLPSPQRAQDDPFTLSQISPKKPSTAGPSTLSPRSPSPVRVTRTRKRPVEDQDEGEDAAAALPPRNKKLKRKPTATAVAAAKKPRGLSNSRSGASAASSSSRPGPSTRQTRSARQLALANSGGAPPSVDDGVAPRVGGPSRGTGNPNPKAFSMTSSGGDQKANTRTVTTTGTRGAGIGLGRPATITPSIQTASVPGPSSTSGPSRSASATTTTKTTPAEFTFRSEARLAARKASQPTQPPQPLLASEPERRAKIKAAIPDFASLHAAELASSMAFRASHAPTPTVPVPLALSTDVRARDREAFDAAVREREAEAETVRAEKRREKEEEDEREMGELRRRAVIKAHEVPEWYADAPKRAHGR